MWRMRYDSILYYIFLQWLALSRFTISQFIMIILLWHTCKHYDNTLFPYISIFIFMDSYNRRIGVYLGIYLGIHNLFFGVCFTTVRLCWNCLALTVFSTFYGVCITLLLCRVQSGSYLFFVCWACRSSAARHRGYKPANVLFKITNDKSYIGAY